MYFVATRVIFEASSSWSSPCSLGGRGAPIDSRSIAAAQNHIGSHRFAAAWAEGRAMTLEQAVAYALDEQPSP